MKCDYFYLGDKKGMLSLNQGMLIVPTQDLSVSAALMRDCQWEGAETDVINNMLSLKDNQNWIEIGANIGYYTVTIGNAMTNSGGHLYAFEASPQLYEYLYDNALLNMLLHNKVVTLHNNAVWKTDGEKIAFKYFDKQMGGSHVDPNDSLRPDVDTIYVDTVTLDSVIPSHENIDVLKMDIEGAECSVLLGARSILEQSTELSIITEWNISMQKAISLADPRECLEYIASFGFNKFYQIGHSVDGDLIETNIDTLSTTPYHMDLLIQRDDNNIVQHQGQGVEDINVWSYDSYDV
jgi:FkbM family methyltransferase